MRRVVLGVVLAVLAGSLAQAGAASAATFPANEASLGAIPDGTSITPPAPGAPRDVTFNVSGLNATAPIDVSVMLTGSHPYLGELEAVLIAPGGAPEQTIFSRTGATTAPGFGDDSDLGGPYTFSDTAANAPGWWSAAASAAGGSAVASGTYRPSEPGGAGASGANTAITPAFASVSNPNGTWTLRVRDVAALNTGSITAASLSITSPVAGSGTGAIPDGNSGPANYGPPLDITFPISGLTAPLTDVAVSLTGNHSYIGDLDVVLIAPDGTTQQTIFSRTGATTGGGFGYPSNLNGSYVFSDGAAATPGWWSAADLLSAQSIPVGTYRASQPGGSGATGANTLITPAFAGLANPNGNWKLRFRDGSTSDTGAITAAGLALTGSTPPPPPPPDPPTPTDTTAPETTIETAKATVKTKRKSAKVKFTVSSSESGSTFECKVDSASFASCGSNPTFKLKKGKHVVQAVAIDAAGNRDASPDSVNVKVKRKPKKK